LSLRPSKLLKVFRVSGGHALTGELEDKVAYIVGQLKPRYFHKHIKVMSSRRENTGEFYNTTLEYFLQTEVAHEYDIQIPPSAKHSLRSVKIVFGCFQPVFGLFLHGFSVS
jgi:hypothetical protein